MAPDNLPHIVRCANDAPVSQQEAEALLRREGYESLCWYDVPGALYPSHAHPVDECLWVLKGQLKLVIGDQEFALKPGDRLYLPKGLPHTAEVPASSSATYLVGQKSA